MTRRWFLAAVPAIAALHRRPTPEDSIREVKAAVDASLKTMKFERWPVASIRFDPSDIEAAVQTAIDRGHAEPVFRALKGRAPRGRRA